MKNTARDEAVTALREHFPPGATVSTVLHHVTKSGMSRSIGVLAVANGEVIDVTYLVARVTGDKVDPRYGGIKMGGCGMDMGYALVYNLARHLYRDGFACIGPALTNERGKSCPSNDHSNERERNYTVGRMHSDPGYALNHRWV